MAFELSAVIRLRDEFTKNMNRVRKSVEKVQESAEKVSRVGDNFDRVGSSLTKKITKPALLAASALAGITMVKGFNRLVGIDTAQAKLQALGHDAASVQQIMDSALASVKGTAYGLDTAATTAASAVAAGIGPGEELTRYLSLTADAAAIAGAGMNEMGSIFNKVQTANRAYNGELQQLADRGLPIYQWLAREAGVAEGSIRDMAANGQISSQMFLKAIENNIGGAAKTMGEKSFSAAVANIGADISRIGAAFLGAGSDSNGFFATVKPMLTDFRGLLSSVEEKAVVWGEKFGEAFNNFVTRIREAKAWFDSLSPTMQTVIKRTLTIGAAVAVGIGPAMKIVGGLMSGFKLLATTAAVMAKPVALVFTMLTTVIKGAATAMMFLTRVMLMNPYGLIVTGVLALVAGIVLLIKHWDKVKNTTIAVWDAIKTATMGAVNFITNLFSNLWDSMFSLFDRMGFLGEILKGYFNAIKTYIQGVWTMITTIISTAINIIKNLIGAVVNVIKGDWSAAWDNIKNIFIAVWDGIKSIFSNTLGTMIGIGKELFGGIWDGMKSIWKNISGWVSDKVSWLTDKLMFWRKSNKEMSETSSSGSKASAAVDGSHYNGLWRVPFDGYLARLHKGERVLTADQADAFDAISYEQVAGQTVNNVTNNAYSTVSNVSSDRKASGPGSVTVTGNTFIVREESDIEKIADKLLSGMKLAWEAGA